MVVHAYLLVALLLAGSPQAGVTQPDGETLWFEPGLVDVNGIYVIVDIRRYPSHEPNDSVFVSQLSESVRANLGEAEISIVDPTLEQLDETIASGMRRILARRLDPGNMDPNSGVFRMASVPALRISIDLVSSNTQTSLATCVRTSFSRQVSLSGRTLKATVWNAVPVVEAAPAMNWQVEVREAVLEQVDAFVAARKTAATQDGRSRLRAAVPARQRNTTSLSAYPYVASKSSSVFHSADCRMARNIAPENLVGYNSREDAVAAGKRPCKTCNP